MDRWGNAVRWFALSMVAPWMLGLGVAEAQSERPVVAVFGLRDTRASLDRKVVGRLSAYITSRLVASRRYKAVPNVDLQQALSRQKRESFKDCYDESCQIEVGKELAASKVLSGEISKIGSRCIVTLALIDLRQFAQEAAGNGRGPCSEDGVLESLDGALSQLLGRARTGSRAEGQDVAAPRISERRADTADGMVRVPGGEFYMGCNERVDSECDGDEKPGRKVSLPAFRIDKTEVTVGAYRECVKADGCSSQGLSTVFWDGKVQSGALYCNWDKPGRENHPINCVSWAGAVSYCRWKGKRLPTEPEWEKAARGSDARKYPWGNRPAVSCKYAVLDDGATTATEGSETDGCGHDSTWPVGSKLAGKSRRHDR